MALQNAFGDLANDKTISDLYNVLAYLADRLEFGINTDEVSVLSFQKLDDIIIDKQSKK